MKKTIHTVLFVLLSTAGIASAATYYPPSEIVETTDPAAAQAVLKQARDIRMQERDQIDHAKKKGKRVRPDKKKTVRKTRTVTEETSVQ